MNGTEIIQVIVNTLPSMVAAAPVSAIVSSVMARIFLRGNTQTEEFEKLKAGKMQEVANDLLASGQMTYTEYYKAKNFTDVAEKADEIFAKNQYTVKKEPYDFDWFIRFYEAVGNISDEDMQDIWAKILAGEINQPHTYSLRLIDVLKNLGKQEAELFETICNHTITIGNATVFPSYKDYLSSCGIMYADMLKMDELGLMRSMAVNTSYTPSFKGRPVCAYNDNLVLEIKSVDNLKSITVENYPFTGVGRELELVQRHITPDQDVIALAETLKTTRKGLIVSVHQRIPAPEGKISYVSIEMTTGNQAKETEATN